MIFDMDQLFVLQINLLRSGIFQFGNQYGAAISPRDSIFYFAVLEKLENQYGAAICTPNGCFSVRGATRLRTSRKRYKT